MVIRTTFFACISQHGCNDSADDSEPEAGANDTSSIWGRHMAVSDSLFCPIFGNSLGVMGNSGGDFFIYPDILACACWNFTDAVWDDNGTIKNRKGILFDSAYA